MLFVCWCIYIINADPKSVIYNGKVWLTFYSSYMSFFIYVNFSFTGTIEESESPTDRKQVIFCSFQFRRPLNVTFYITIRADLFEVHIETWIHTKMSMFHLDLKPNVTIIMLTTLIQLSTWHLTFVFMGTLHMWSKHILSKLYKIISIASHKITNIIVFSRLTIATNKQLCRILYYT